MSKSEGYRRDLAYIHDAGFGDFARYAAAELIRQLSAATIKSGLLVELGSGSGILAHKLSAAGYDVLGFDISPAMVELARIQAPRAQFRCQSFLGVQPPPCVAVAAVGEIFNYLFDRRNQLARLRSVFRRVHRALAPGGLFLFDVATVGREPTGTRRSFREGDGWACLFEATEFPKTKQLERRIITFRRHGKAFRRDDETHRLRLYDRDELIEPLRELGFRVSILPSYGKLQFPPGYLSVLARKAQS